MNGSAAALVLILAIVVLPSSAANNSGLVVEPSEPSVPDLAGDWRLTLLDDDNISREVNLTLYQAEKEVFGWGNMTADNVTRRMVAGGSLEEDFLNLYLITEEVDLLFRLTFKVGDDSMSGDYRGYSSDGAVINGNGSGYWYPPSGTAAGLGPKPNGPPKLKHPSTELSSLGPKPKK